jgi:hypothetical protein
MFQDRSIDRDLHIVINQSQRKVEEDGHLVEDGEEHREGPSQCEMDEGEEKNQVSLASYWFHSTPIKMDEKQSSGEIPRWRMVPTF